MIRSKGARRLQLALLAALAAAGFASAGAGPAHAADGASFLKELEGSWRGRGSAWLPGRKAPERVTCQVTNRYDGGSLVVDGECASTQGKTKVSGKLTSSGNSVSGALLNAFEGATITKSTGSIEGERLVVSSNFVNDATNQLTRTRQVVKLGSGGFTAEFFTYDNGTGKFEPAGDISFSGK